MIRRVIFAAGRFGRGAGRAVFNRRTANVVRWKLFGPSLDEWSALSRTGERAVGRSFVSTLRAGHRAVTQQRLSEVRKLLTAKRLRNRDLGLLAPRARIYGAAVQVRRALATRRGAGKYGGIGAFRGRGRGWRRFLRSGR